MSLPEYLIAREGDACRCGRIASRPHCPSCGSFKVRFMPSLSRDALNPKGVVGPTADKVRKFFRCDICSLVFEEAERKNCEAPVYETKALRAVAEVIRTKRAVLNNEPLTQKEERIVQNLNRNPILDEELTSFVEQEQVEARIKDFKLEWTRAKLNQTTTETVDEFVLRRRQEERV